MFPRTRFGARRSREPGWESPGKVRKKGEAGCFREPGWENPEERRKKGKKVVPANRVGRAQEKDRIIEELKRELGKK